MKAYMSDRTARPDSRHSDSMWEALGATEGTFVGMIFAREAEREARRILAETQGDCEPATLKSGWQTFPFSCRAALAEALAAFIDLPLRCAVCGEVTGGEGSSFYGSVHKYGPTSYPRPHVFTPTL